MKIQWQMAWLSLVLLASGSACIDETFIQLAPRIDADVCQSNGVDSCAVDFGTVALSTRATKEILISNFSNVSLDLQQPTFSADSDPSFRVEHWPDHVGEGLNSKMIVSFRPMVEAAVTATLLIKSNAVNVPKGQAVEITLTGNGVDQGLPQIEIIASEPCSGTFPGSTEAANLGITGVGHPLACTFEIFNRGSKDLVVENIQFVADQTDVGFEFVGRVPGLDPESGERFESTIPPPADGTTSSRSFVVRGIPSELGIFHGLIRVDSNDPGCINGGSDCGADERRSKILVPVMIEGAQTPEASAHILSVNGDTDFSPNHIEPLDDVVLTAAGSAASSSSLSLVEYRWEIINQPVGSHGSLDDPSSETPRFVFDNSNHMVPGVDIAGFWEVRLTVIDSRGVASVNEAVVTFNAIPTEAIHVQLVWDHPDSDVDLHLLWQQPDGSYAPFDDNLDCYFGDCKVTGSGVDWFPNYPQANPTLDVDDISGYGPENINIKLPQPGTFKVAVHYWSDHGEGNTVAVLRLFLFGNLDSEYIMELTNHDWWDVATITWPSHEVSELGDVTPDVTGL